MPTTPVRPTSTSPSSRISAMKLSIFSGVAGDFEDEALGRGVDHLGAENVGQAQRLDPLFARAGDLDQRQLALDVRAGFGEVDHLVHRHQPFKLRVDLVDHRGRAVGDDGDAADRVVFGDVGHGQAVDIVAARGEQPGDLGEDARFVVDE